MPEISKNFQETFLEGKHLHERNFDESMEKTVKCFLPQPEKIGGHDMEIMQDFLFRRTE